MAPNGSRPDTPLSIYTFDISFNSCHDGPGTRVVLFFQGCNANCSWCHSPHSQGKISPLLFKESHCSYCGRCQSVCSQNVHLVEDGHHYLDRSNCIQCGSCIQACPNSFIYRKAGVLHLATIKKTVTEMYEQLLPHLNMVKYDGGITLSGGEALIQYKAAAELLRLCKKSGFSTAIETSGLLPAKYYKGLDGLVDYWLFGMRFTTDFPRIKHTQTIADYMAIISQYNQPIRLRLPVVPGHTDSDWYLKQCGDLMLKNKIKRVYINSWNRNTDHYYHLTGRVYAITMPSEEAVIRSEEKICNYFKDRGFEVR